MDEDEIWLSEEEDEDDEEFTGASKNPTSFSLALTYQGQPGDYHVRQQPGKPARTAVSAFHGGSKRKPAFTASCNAKAMIHGNMGLPSKKPATLLVYEFKFNSYRGARIKEADILFEFYPKEGQAGGPSVAQVRPRGLHKMEETEQTESEKRRLELKVGNSDAGLTLGEENSVEKATKHYTVVTGDKPQSDEWGNFYQARFSLSENKSQKSGIPSELTACILLEREDDQDFVCVPYIEATPNFTTVVTSLFSSRAPDDPIPFSVKDDPFNALDGTVAIDRNDLGATELDKLWDCTMYNKYGGAIKPSKPEKDVKENNDDKQGNKKDTVDT